MLCWKFSWMIHQSSTMNWEWWLRWKWSMSTCGMSSPITNIYDYNEMLWRWWWSSIKLRVYHHSVCMDVVVPWVVMIKLRVHACVARFVDNWCALLVRFPSLPHHFIVVTLWCWTTPPLPHWLFGQPILFDDGWRKSCVYTHYGHATMIEKRIQKNEMITMHKKMNVWKCLDKMFEKNVQLYFFQFSTIFSLVDTNLIMFFTSFGRLL